MTFATVQERFTAHMRNPAANAAPDDVEDRRLEIYRGLLYRNVEGFLANAFPVLRSLFEEADWHALVRDYFEHHRARTPYFPKMPQEFLRYLDEREDGPEGPPFMRELAHYEWLEAEILFNPKDIDELDLDSHPSLRSGVPVPNPALSAQVYAFPVHRIGPDYQPDSPPETPTYLVVFRHRDDRVGFMELNAVSARLLQLVLAGEGRSGASLLEQIATELQHPQPDAVVTNGLAILADFLERDILAGTRSDN